MSDFLRRLKQRKLVQWAVAYVAAVFALLQGIDIVATKFGWPDAIERILIIAACVGFFVVLVLAWYHGERGAQKVSATELTILALLLAIGGGFLWHFAATLPAPVAASPEKAADTATAIPPVSSKIAPDKSIAVLPFENLSKDADNKYFADGMQDLVLTKLADIGDLKVISRTSTMKYASHPDDLKTIAQQLGVATILEGSVQKAGNQVLINVQLINANSDSHIWAQSYTRTLKNIFGVEGEVAEQIATALKAKLSPAETQRLATALTSDPAANDLYLRAEYFAIQAQINYATASMKQAIPLYKEAIEKVPDFALARARLSYVESYLAWGGGGGEDVQQLRTDARAQAKQALAQAPNMAEAYLAFGYSDYLGRGDYAGALIAFTVALKARPNDAAALAARGYVLRRQGRFEDAIAAFQQALARDPRNSALAFELGSTCMMVGRDAEAEAALQHALALDPDNLNAKSFYSQVILYHSGDVARALAAAQGDAPRLQSQRVSLLTYQRKYQEALALLAGIPDTPDNFFTFFSGSKTQQQADLYLLAGDTARAKTLYEKALPLARAQVTAQAGNDSNESLVWSNVADVELGLGDTAAGLAAIAQSQVLMTRANNHLYGPLVLELNAHLYAEVDRPDLAAPLLAKALASPGIGAFYSPVLLWLDPAWDPIRHDPHFEVLLKKYADAAPAVASSEAKP